MKDTMIMIGAYSGPRKDWKNLSKVLTKDLRNVGISAQVFARRGYYRVRFNCSEDLHMAVLSGILALCEGPARSMKAYRYVKQ
jgi:hypothetical protein